MPANMKKLEQQLDAVFGGGYRLSEPQAVPGAFLPPYFKRRFSFYLLQWKECAFILAEWHESETGDAASMPAAMRHVESYFGTTPILCWREMTVKHARLLREEGVSYISAHAGFFIPSLWSYAPQSAVHVNRPQTALSPCAQAILIRQLVLGDVEGRNVRILAGLMPYSHVLLGRARDELVRHHLCRYHQGTRAGSFRFPSSTASLWEASAHLLISPVRDSYRVRLKDCRKFLQAGATALSKLTLVGDDILPTYAYYCRKVAERIPRAPLTEAGAVLQLWSYPPEAVVSPDAGAVDACSLYLSLKNDLDPRIQLALPQIWNP